MTSKFDALKTLPIALSTLIMAPQVIAQASTTGAEEVGALEEVTVTATRRESGAQSTPISLSAIGGAELEKKGITSMAQLAQLAPSMYVQEGLASGSPRFSLRGISSTEVNWNSNSPVAIYFDDVYQATQYGIGMQLFDLERIEVLRGPQGTLFGKNTTGGAVSYFSRAPVNEFEGYVAVRGASGRQSERGVEGAINVPLIQDTLAMRLSFKTVDLGSFVRDSYLNRKYGEGDSQGARLQLKWTPSESTTVSLQLSGSDNNMDQPVYHALYIDPCNDPSAAVYLCSGGVPLPTPPLSANAVALTDIPGREDFTSRDALLRINQHFDAFDITSITSYGYGKFDQLQDADGAPGDFLQLRANLKRRQIGQEVRLATNADHALNGVFGLYFMNDSVDSDSAYASTTLGPPFDYLQSQDHNTKTKTYAAFASLTYKMNEQLSFIGGVRKSDEKRSMTGNSEYFFPFNSFFDWEPGNVIFNGNPPVPADAVIVYDEQVKAKPTTWDATVDYRPAQTLLVFGRIAKGFRSGGFNTASLLRPNLSPPFAPETLKSYEIGVKSDWLARTLRVNATVYHYSYTDQQVGTIFGGILFTSNAGTSKVDGGELEITALPVRSVELSANLGYADARYTHYVSELGDYSGHPLAQAPKLTASVSAAYTRNIGDRLALRGSTVWSYRDKVYFDPSEDPQIGDPSLVLGNFRLELEQQNGTGLSLAAFVNNVADKRYIQDGFGFQPVEYGKIYAVGRTYGADLRYRW